MPTNLYVMDLFAGCGGLSLGLHLAGYRTLLFSELSTDARDTFSANIHGHGAEAQGSIFNLTDDALRSKLAGWKREGKGIDLVCGGPPCQGYSGIGHRRSYAVDKEEIPSNHLYKEMIRVIRAVKPRMFLFENVRGILSGRWTESGSPQEIWKEVRGAFEAIDGYEVRHAVVRARDYGVPQNRPRVLLVGIRTDLGWKPNWGRVADGLLPEPTGTRAPHPHEIWSDLVDDDWRSRGETTRYLRKPSSEYQVIMRTSADCSLLARGAMLHEQVYSRHSDRVVEKFREMLASKDGSVPDWAKTKKFAQRVLRREWPSSGPFITATSLPDDYVHYEQPRSFTVREWARLQGFPDWFHFCGKRTTGGIRRAGNPHAGVWDRETPKYTQIGNAVPVLLAKSLGEHFRQFLA